jgi:hypothetical protein
MSDDELVYPLPGAITRDGDNPGNDPAPPWIYLPYDGTSAAATDLISRKLRVPLEDDDVAHGLRIHELLHVQLTPSVMPADQFAQAAEDARIETIATRAGLKRDYGVQPGLAVRLLNEGRVADAYCAAVCSVGAGDEHAERQVLLAQSHVPPPSLMATSGPDLAKTARRILLFMDWVTSVYDEDSSFAASERVAERLREMFPPKPERTPDRGEQDHQGDGETDKSGQPSPSSQSSSPPTPPSPANVESDETAETAETAEHNPRLQIGNRRPKSRRKQLPPVRMPSRAPVTPAPVRAEIPVTVDEIAAVTPVAGYPTPAWARDYFEHWPLFTIQHPSLIRPVVCLGRGGTKAAEYGSYLRQPWRLTTDDKVFRTSRHVRRGTVLIDRSGSMSLKASAIEHLIRNTPAALIAAYGFYEPGIRILADGGRMCSGGVLGNGGSNAIDGPAIEWLGRQRTPRVLVTDMEWNDGLQELSDGYGGHLMKALEAAIERYRITIVYSPDEAAPHLR